MELHRFAWFVAAAAWVLIGIGSLVTTTGSGLSIPDWPLAYGRPIPPRWEGGVAFEYTHRVVAGTVFVLMTILLVRIWRTDSARRVRSWALGTWGLLVMQAILGGVTVLYELPRPVSIAHAGLAQATLVAMVVLAVKLAPVTPVETTPVPAGRRGRLFPWVFGLVGILYLQILIGALVRHMAAGLAVPDFPLAYGRLWPPAEVFHQAPYLAPKIWVHMIHRVGAVLVGVVIHAVGIPALRRFRDVPAIAETARLLMYGWALQIVLGGWLIWWTRHWFPTTLHVMTGALLLAAGTFLALRLRGVEAGCKS